MNGKFSKTKKFVALLIGAIMLLGMMPLSSLAADISPEAVVYTRPEILAARYNQIGKNYVYVDVLVYGEQVKDQPVVGYLLKAEDGEPVNDEVVALAYAPINKYLAELTLGVPDEAETGEYLLIVAPNKAEIATGYIIFYVGVGDVDGFFEAVNMTDVEASVVKEKIDAHYEALSVVKFTEDEDGLVILQLTGDDYENLSEKAKENFAELILNGVNGQYSNGKGEFDETNSESFIKEAYILAAYNAATKEDKDLADLLYRFESVIGFDSEDEDLYGKIQNKDTLSAVIKTVDKEVESVKELATALEEAAAIQLVNETHWLNLVDVVKANNDIFEVDEDEIKKLLAKKSFRKIFCEYFSDTYYSIEEVQDGWDKAYEKAEDKYEESQSSTSSGPSGPSGPSIREETIIKNVSTQITNAENNYDPNVEILDYYLDMAGYQWSSEAVLNLTKKGLVSGYGDKTFAPGNSLTRAEFTKMIVNVFSLADITATSSFTDVDKNAWYHIYIASAEKYGLAQGYGDGRFGVNDPITRQDAITLIYRAAQAKGVSTQRFYTSAEVFKDKAEIAPYALDAVSALYNAGIYIDAIEPTTVDVFAPTKNASRAYVAVVLNQLYLYME